MGKYEKIFANGRGKSDMRGFWSTFFRFLVGWLIAFLILCVISVVKYWDVLVDSLSNDISVLLQTGVVIFLTIYIIVLLIDNVFR